MTALVVFNYARNCVLGFSIPCTETTRESDGYVKFIFTFTSRLSINWQFSNACLQGWINNDFFSFSTVLGTRTGDRLSFLHQTSKEVLFGIPVYTLKTPQRKTLAATPALWRIPLVSVCPESRLA